MYVHDIDHYTLFSQLALMWCEPGKGTETYRYIDVSACIEAHDITPSIFCTGVNLFTFTRPIMQYLCDQQGVCRHRVVIIRGQKTADGNSKKNYSLSNSAQFASFCEDWLIPAAFRVTYNIHKPNQLNSHQPRLHIRTLYNQLHNCFKCCCWFLAPFGPLTQHHLLNNCCCSFALLPLFYVKVFSVMFKVLKFQVKLR